MQFADEISLFLLLFPILTRTDDSIIPKQLKLSIEHSGFIFEKDPSTAIDMLKEHSGGKVSEVLKMAVGVERL